MPHAPQVEFQAQQQIAFGIPVSTASIDTTCTIPERRHDYAQEQLHGTGSRLPRIDALEKRHEGKWLHPVVHLWP